MSDQKNIFMRPIGEILSDWKGSRQPVSQNTPGDADHRRGYSWVGSDIVIHPHGDWPAWYWHSDNTTITDMLEKNDIEFNPTVLCSVIDESTFFVDVVRAKFDEKVKVYNFRSGHAPRNGMPERALNIYVPVFCTASNPMWKPMASVIIVGDEATIKKDLTEMFMFFIDKTAKIRSRWENDIRRSARSIRFSTDDGMLEYDTKRL